MQSMSSEAVKAADISVLLYTLHCFHFRVVLSASPSISFLVGLQSAFYMSYHTLPINFVHCGLFWVINVGGWMINDTMTEGE